MSFLPFLMAMDRTAFPQETEAESSRKIVTRADPLYPELARKMNLQGTVRLMVTVAPNGNAKSVRTIGGNPVLAKAAEDAVYKFRWA